MKFRTTFSLPRLPAINHDTSIWCVGSCFANTMGTFLSEGKFDVTVNPFGVIFNPISIFRLLGTFSDDFTEKQLDSFIEEGLLQSGSIWYHDQLHSEINASSREELYLFIKQYWKTLKASWDQCEYIILTLGTAWVYDTKEGRTVANCHKLPQKQFVKRLLSITEIMEASEVLPKDKKIIITVSPVRHIKDTLPLNTVSKSTLLLASHQMEHVVYFPSYEIMMDDLRDYRFYKEDMLHPTLQAQDYIWGKFCEASMDSKTKDLINRWDKIKNSLAHKAFHPDSDAHQIFLKKLMDALVSISDQLPVQEEINVLKNKILR